MHIEVRSVKRAWPLLIGPAAFLAVFVLLGNARGPFYLAFNYDPEYAYLFNGLNLINGIAPEHIDHPGTTLQLFVAACIKLINIGSSTQAATATVIAHSESYLFGLNVALALVYFAALLLFGFIVWRRTSHMGAAVLLQASPFLLAEDFYETVRFRPEALMLIVILAMASFLYIQLWRDTPETTASICLLSGLAATAVVTKINFGPFLLVPLFCLRRWTARALYLGLLCLFTSIWLLPLNPHYGRLLAWVHGLITHQDRYGSGQAGWFPPRYTAHLAQIIGNRPIFFLTMLLSAVALIYLSRKQRTPDENRMTKLLAGLLVAEFMEYIMVGKFEQARYLTPAMAFSTLNWAVLLTLGFRWQTDWSRRWPLAAVYISALAFTVICSGRALCGRYVQMKDSRDIHVEMARVVEKEYVDKTLIYYFGCSSLYYADWFGNSYAGRRYGPIITNLFPSHSPAYMVEIFPDKTYWYSVAGPDLLIEERLERGEVLFAVGKEWPSYLERSNLIFLPKDVAIEKERHMGEEAIYRIGKSER